MNLDSLRTAADLSATKPHGTRLKYMAGVSACSVARQTRATKQSEKLRGSMATGMGSLTPVPHGATS